MVATPVRRVVLAATQVQIDWTNLKPYRLFGLFWSRVYDRLHVCIRFSVECGCLRLARGGELIQWSSWCRYLDVYFCYCWQVFFDHSKYQFFASFIAIFSKVGRFASEEVVLNFLRAKCLSVSWQSCPLLAWDKRSLEFTVTRSFMKLFQTGSVAVVSDCQHSFYFLPITCQIDIRTHNFFYRNLLLTITVFAHYLVRNLK